MRIDVTIQDAEVQSLLKQVAVRVSDMKPVMRTIGETVKRSIQKTFDSGGRPTKWPESHRVKVQGGETLKDTGILKNSINVNEVTNDSVSVGTSDKRAAVLHFGAKKHSFGEFAVREHQRIIKSAFGQQLKFAVAVTVKAHTVKLPWGDIPARPFMMVQDEDLVEINGQLAAYIENGAVGSR